MKNNNKIIDSFFKDTGSSILIYTIFGLVLILFIYNIL